jgi:hypothetical protein
MGENETLIEVIDSDPSIKVGQRRREPTEVVGVPSWRHVHVVSRLEWSTLGYGGERPDHQVVHVMAIQHGEDVLG